MSVPTPHRDAATHLASIFRLMAEDAPLAGLDAPTWRAAMKAAAEIVETDAALREPMWHQHAQD